MIKEFEQYTDNEIIHKICNGDQALLEILIRRYNPFMYKIGRGYGYNHHDTEDLMQETYINCYNNLSKFEGRSSFKTWLTRIMLNECYHKKQKHSFQKEIIMENKLNETSTPMFQNNTPFENSILNKELGHILENAVSLIPEDYRMVFMLRELNGLNVAETAEVLDISESNVKVRLNRAKTMLKTEIEKMYSPQDIFEFNLIYCDKMVADVMKRIAK
ncbi:MAG: sigma-70 family RNA polymerase sigma factor [Bacteroidia bacterium]